MIANSSFEALFCTHANNNDTECRVDDTMYEFIIYDKCTCVHSET